MRLFPNCIMERAKLYTMIQFSHGLHNVIHHGVGHTQRSRKPMDYTMRRDMVRSTTLSTVNMRLFIFECTVSVYTIGLPIDTFESTLCGIHLGVHSADVLSRHCTLRLLFLHGLIIVRRDYRTS